MNRNKPLYNNGFDGNSVFAKIFCVSVSHRPIVPSNDVMSSIMTRKVKSIRRHLITSLSFSYLPAALFLHLYILFIFLMQKLYFHEHGKCEKKEEEKCEHCENNERKLAQDAIYWFLINYVCQSDLRSFGFVTFKKKKNQFLLLCLFNVFALHICRSCLLEIH